MLHDGSRESEASCVCCPIGTGHGHTDGILLHARDPIAERCNILQKINVM